MAVSDYTDVVARFADELGAEVFAKFVASEGISCHITGIVENVDAERYGVRVQRDRIADLRRVLRLKPLGNTMAPLAAQSMAHRLAREGIPCCVTNEPEHLFDEPPATTAPASKPGHLVAVPEAFLWLAMSILNLTTPGGYELAGVGPGKRAS